MKLVAKRYPQYLVYHEMLGLNLVGVKQSSKSLKPENLRSDCKNFLKAGPTDELLAAMERVLMISLSNSGLTTQDFGVFGSMLHGFHHPKYSDIDFVVYGKDANSKMRKTLQTLYSDKAFRVRQ